MKKKLVLKKLVLNKKNILSLKDSSNTFGGNSTQLPCVSDMTMVNCLSKVYLCGEFDTWINCGPDVRTYHRCTVATN